MFYVDILTEIYQKGVKYLIVGGLAVNLHGIPRVTQDIDLIISMAPENIQKLITILEDAGYIPRLPINPIDLLDSEKTQRWIKDRNLKAFSFYHNTDSFKVIDLILSHPLDFELAFKNKTVKLYNDLQLFLVSIDDLIAMKKGTGRQQDLSDIEMLERLKIFLEEETE